MTPSEACQNIVLRAANWVGDAVMTTPALRAIRKGLPRARITVLAKPWVAPVFWRNPNIDRIFIFDNRGRHSGVRGLLRLSRELRQLQFDTAVLFQNAFEAALLAWLARIPNRVGFTTDGRSALLSRRIRNWKQLKKGHLIDYYLGLVNGMGLPPQGRDLEVFITEQERRQAWDSLARAGVSRDYPIVGLNPGGAHGTAKRWPLDRFADAARRLMTRYGAQILIFGAPDEASLGVSLQKTIGPGSFNLAGQTTLRRAMTLVDCCGLFITNDSGLMHVAAALNKPQVVIVGSTNTAATGPANPLSRVTASWGACSKSPCLLAHCPIDHRCMLAVSVEQVLQACIDLMDMERPRV